jgi:outer membrane immunogenic protein
MLRMICGAAAITSAGAASAADIQRPYATAPYLVSAYSWTGPYVGGQLGYQWGSTANARPASITGGVRAGYSGQTGAFVFGGEADLNLSGAEDRFAGWKFANPWFGTLRARVGYAFSNVLVYGTLGLAAGGGRAELGGASESRTHVGWAAGGGLEVGLTAAWSARVEYLHVDLSDPGDPDCVTFHREAVTFRGAFCARCACAARFIIR